jgi:uncharacterized protein (TIGR03435 family)
MERSRAKLAVGVVVAVRLFAQGPAAFEVASIRVHSFEAADRAGPPITGNRLTLSGNLYQLIMYAYDLKGYQVSGGPTWATRPSTQGDYYDIRAKAEGEETLTSARSRESMQTLLADRFQLRLHRERKEMQVYALVVDRGRPKFKESAADAISRSGGSVSPTTVISTFTKSSMDALVRVLSGAADRPVINETGLSGLYDFKLEFARAADSDAPSIFTAVQELGLKLEPKKGLVEVVVIDGAERPSEN